ncbi:unnamed protein product [Protopolystoma xenopodis]|uniref:Uncharacterized protein n=1 Tax=Protopolystoma xenopodis TaxID=117903 RepID=A0A3S5FCJ9_9PLAT|nr:unnamed protein product [Protopolystoma xenopodis]
MLSRAQVDSDYFADTVCGERIPRLCQASLGAAVYAKWDGALSLPRRRLWGGTNLGVHVKDRAWGMNRHSVRMYANFSWQIRAPRSWRQEISPILSGLYAQRC